MRSIFYFSVRVQSSKVKVKDFTMNGIFSGTIEQNKKSTNLKRGLNPVLSQWTQKVKDRARREEFLRNQKEAKDFAAKAHKRGLIGVEIGEHYKREDQVFLSQEELNFNRLSTPDKRFKFLIGCFEHSTYRNENGDPRWAKDSLYFWLLRGAKLP